MAISGPLIDRFGRVHTSLRVSVTDRCNIRCFYCMPAENVRFLPRREILTFEEITRFVRVCAALGVTKVRLTGGEPLVRADLPRLVEMLAGIPGIDDLAMTTNGLLLAEQAGPLRRAGLHRLNISLDALNEETFQRISRRRGLAKILDGIQAAIQAGFTRIRLNAVAIRGITEPEIIPLAEYARQHRLELRFIEFMPLDADQAWQRALVLKGEEIRALLEEHYGPLQPATRSDPAQPAVDFFYADGEGKVGFINPVTQPFCHECNRLRITAEGQVRNCLFSVAEWDARRLLRGGATDEQIAELIRDCVGAKKPGHGIDQPDFVRPGRAMFEIGG
jgi:cyclic pyranopterin phosphate synthase